MCFIAAKEGTTLFEHEISSASVSTYLGHDIFNTCSIDLCRIYIPGETDQRWLAWSDMRRVTEESDLQITTWIGGSCLC